MEPVISLISPFRSQRSGHRVTTTPSRAKQKPHVLGAPVVGSSGHLSNTPSFLRKLQIVVLLFLGSLPALGAGRVECGSANSKFMRGPVAYCALLPPSYDAQPAKKFPVLYFLHGLGGD